VQLSICPSEVQRIANSLICRKPEKVLINSGFGGHSTMTALNRKLRSDTGFANFIFRAPSMAASGFTTMHPEPEGYV
jgi:hypothetical protein